MIHIPLFDKFLKKVLEFTISTELSNNKNKVAGLEFEINKWMHGVEPDDSTTPIDCMSVYVKKPRTISRIEFYRDVIVFKDDLENNNYIFVPLNGLSNIITDEQYFQFDITNNNLDISFEELQLIKDISLEIEFVNSTRYDDVRQFYEKRSS